jgi:hypothetical protein
MVGAPLQIYDGRTDCLAAWVGCNSFVYSSDLIAHTPGDQKGLVDSPRPLLGVAWLWR